MGRLDIPFLQVLQYFIIIAVYLHNAIAENKDEDISYFPKHLSIGAATSAYQIEGAWNISDKGLSTWDKFVHEHPEYILDHSTGDVACDSYHKYKEDAKLVKDLGFNHYRFSISWTRVLPTGRPNVVSKDGVKYYHNLLDELEANGIEPYVTIFHWDHPSAFDKFGSWLNEEMVNLFGDYARFVFAEFGHRVKIFATINEPNIFCRGYRYDDFLAPGFNKSMDGLYLCVHNLIKAHARAYHIYDKEFRAHQKGKIGMVIPCAHFISKNENDYESNELAFQFDCGWMAHPIFSKNGDYPEIMKKTVAERRRITKNGKPGMPKFSKFWIKYIKGTYDYFGLNHYQTALVEPLKPNTVNPDDSDGDIPIIFSEDPKWKGPKNSWKLVPEGFRDLLRKIKQEYSNPPIYIMENGVSLHEPHNDTWRITHIRAYLKKMLEAIKFDDCNVRAYTVWSLLDNFEWGEGYTSLFGIVNVDFESPNRTRILKKSALWFKKILHAGRLDKEE